MYKRVLFCIPPSMGVHRWPGAPHAGVGYLSEFLSSNGIQSDVVDMRLGYSIKDLRKRIRAFTMVTYRHDIAYEIIGQIKSPKYKIVVGGPHVSAMRKKILMDTEADFGVKFEGEYTLLELCAGHALEDIPGLIYKSGSEIIENENRPRIENLDEIPFPRYEKFDLDLYGCSVIPIVSSRGCPHNCIYCPVKVTMGREYRARSAESVVDEMKYWYDRGYRSFDFSDDNFTVQKDRIYKFCDLLEEYGLSNISLMCTGMRADRVNRDLLKRMKDVGFGYLAFGVESGSDKILQRIKKGEDVDTIERAIKDACELGFDVGLFFMIGLPDETPSDVEASFRLALKYPVQHANFYNVIPFPGTELYEWVKTNNYSFEDLDIRLRTFQHFDIDPFFETPEFSLDERKEALVKSKRVMAEIINRNTKREMEKISKWRGLVLRTYRFVNNLINYYSIWSWLLKNSPNKTIRRSVLILGRRLMGFFGQSKPS